MSKGKLSGPVLIAPLAVVGLLLAVAINADDVPQRQPILRGPTEIDLSRFPTQEQVDSLHADINADFASIKPILVSSCYDCHTSQTVFPWYHSLPIVKGFMDGHIEEAREHLDMSNDFPFNGGADDQLHLLDEMKEEIEEGAMPLLSYRLMHWGTLIESERQDSVFRWIDRTGEKIRQFRMSHNMMFDDEDIPIEEDSV